MYKSTRSDLRTSTVRGGRCGQGGGRCEQGGEEEADVGMEGEEEADVSREGEEGQCEQGGERGQM